AEEAKLDRLSVARVECGGRGGQARSEPLLLTRLGQAGIGSGRNLKEGGNLALEVNQRPPRDAARAVLIHGLVCRDARQPMIDARPARLEALQAFVSRSEGLAERILSRLPVSEFGHQHSGKDGWGVRAVQRGEGGGVALLSAAHEVGLPSQTLGAGEWWIVQRRCRVLRRRAAACRKTLVRAQ